MNHSLLPVAGLALVLAAALLPTTATAQTSAPTWTSVSPNLPVTTPGFVNAVAADASGNLLVVGSFTGTATFGSNTITSRLRDWFVAKWVPATNTWAWAVRAGGRYNDQATGVAVSGSSIYVCGYADNDAADANTVTFGGSSGALASQAGATATESYDLVLAKYTDNGSSVAFNWSQVGGGTGDDRPTGVAVSGSSVYVAGSLFNSRTNASAVVFGGSGLMAGTAPQYGIAPAGSDDMVLAKYTDNGTSGTFGWSQVGGGAEVDEAAAVAASGSSVYVTGRFVNDQADTYQARLGGSGSTPGSYPVKGARAAISVDLLLAKYVDNGPTASVGWTQVAGGTGEDEGTALAVQGSHLYVAGTFTNSTTNAADVVLGGDGSTAGTRPQYGASTNSGHDLLLACYTDQGSRAGFEWSQVAGGRAEDIALAVAVSGSSVYLAGAILNDNANTNAVVLGGSGSTAGTLARPGIATAASPDLLLARYRDNGATATCAWAQVAGGEGSDYATSVAVAGTRVLVGGSVVPPATFGSLALTGSAFANTYVVAALYDPALPTRADAPGGALALCPNPTAGAATLTGTTPGAPVQVLDALGRVAATATADAGGTAYLSSLAPGLYLVRAGAATARLAVE